MRGLPALHVGNAVAVERNALIERLESSAGKQTSTAAPRGDALVGEMVLYPGELRIPYTGQADLAQKLSADHRAVTRDWQGFARQLQPAPPASPAPDDTANEERELRRLPYPTRQERWRK